MVSDQYQFRNFSEQDNEGPNLTDSFLSTATHTVVYDSIETSPFYSNTAGDMYIDERELIELSSPHANSVGQIKEPYQKRYYFNPMNLPYNLEQPSNYSVK